MKQDNFDDDDVIYAIRKFKSLQGTVSHRDQ